MTSLKDDPYLWLEDVHGERALAWVRARNAESRALLEADPEFATLRERIREVLDSKDRIPSVTRRGDWFYNLWQDEDHPRGLWRRTTLAEYRKASPDWEIVLDLDALGRAEQESWVWGGAMFLGPEYRLGMLALSRGGADATVWREFDAVTKRFVVNGFVLPEAKSEVTWVDADTLLVGTDFGPGSLTDSGYPRLIKRWRRGQPLDEAESLFEAQAGDVAAWANVDLTPGFERIFLGRSPDFYSTEQFRLLPEGLRKVDKPDDAVVVYWYAQVLMQLRSEFLVGSDRWPAGSLLVSDAAAFDDGHARWTALFVPTPTRSLADFSVTRTTVLLNILDNVASRVQEWRLDQAGHWSARDVAAPFPGTLAAHALHDSLISDDLLAEAYTLEFTDFLTPDSLLLANTGHDARELLKMRPAFFDASGMRVEQRFVRSVDGVQVPYFVVWPRGATADGSNPTLLYGYGGFEIALQPWYPGEVGRAWLERGGVLAVANIRGGGEFGPAWHQAALREHRQRAFDDFAAVAQDLIDARVTRPPRLAIEGGSNGGLLVGAVMLQRPELFGAVVCQVPLLDMRRYHHLLAGASWMAEYGNPDDPDDWSFIARYSPYQNVPPAGTRLPPVLFTTSTRDDRVHPGHARKMAARMQEYGHPVLYYENIEGGHGGAADNRQRADMKALEFTFLWNALVRDPTC
jgi:prolyl oligopeptidase